MKGLRGFLVGVLALVLANGAFTQNLGQREVVVIVKATNSQFWQYVLEGAKRAGQDLGVKITPQGAAEEADIAGQISILENAIARKPAAIVIAPTASKPLAAPVEKATRQGIPVVLIDSAAETRLYAAFLATDNVAAGRLAARELVQAIQRKRGKVEGSVAILSSVPGVSSVEQRNKGFLEEIRKYPGLKVVENRYANNDPARALSITLDYLSRYPNLVGIFANNNVMGSSAGRALEQKGNRKVALVAFDSDEQEVDLLKKGYIDALIVQDPFLMGYAGVWYAVAASFGVPLPITLDTGSYAITQANANSEAVRGLLDPSQRRLTPFLGGSR